MEQWLEWARGPVFRACFAIMLLGLLRVVALNTGASSLSSESAGRTTDDSLRHRIVRRHPASGCFLSERPSSPACVPVSPRCYSTSAVIMTPLFSAPTSAMERGWDSLAGDQQLRGGCSDPAGIATAIALFVDRVIRRACRSYQPGAGLSSGRLLIAVALLSGYLAMHPGTNPFHTGTTSSST